MVVSQPLASLKQRRPQLRIATRGSDSDETRMQFVATAAPFCS